MFTRILIGSSVRRMEAPCSLARFSNIATTRQMPLTMVVRLSQTEKLTTSQTVMDGAKLELLNRYIWSLLY